MRLLLTLVLCVACSDADEPDTPIFIDPNPVQQQTPEPVWKGVASMCATATSDLSCWDVCEWEGMVCTTTLCDGTRMWAYEERGCRGDVVYETADLSCDRNRRMLHSGTLAVECCCQTQ